MFKSLEEGESVDGYSACASSQAPFNLITSEEKSMIRIQSTDKDADGPDFFIKHNGNYFKNMFLLLVPLLFLSLFRTRENFP